MPTYKEDRMKAMKQVGLTVALMLSTQAGGPTENNLKEPIEERFGGFTPFLKSPEDEEANAAASKRELKINKSSKSSKSAKAKAFKSLPPSEPSSAPSLSSGPSRCFERLVYQGDVLAIEGGFFCNLVGPGTDTDDEIDARADAACNSAFPGSRNIRGVDIAARPYQNVEGLPDNPVNFFVPSCLGCGLGCDSAGRGGRRLVVLGRFVEWNELTSEVALGTEDSEEGAGWKNNVIGATLSAMCVKELTCV
eukprot:scaffold41002_cov42-Attheya_sp.AAC.3